MSKLPADEVEKSSQLRQEAMALQTIENNPFDAEDLALFEMFEREAWTHEQRRTFLLAKAKPRAR
jgi:hypothetical protein